MSDSGKRILAGAREALAVAQGKTSAYRITVGGHTYVDASYVSTLEARLEKAREVIKPFAEHAAHYDPEDCDGSHIAHIKASLAQLRAARAWMEQNDEHK